MLNDDTLKEYIKYTHNYDEPIQNVIICSSTIENTTIIVCYKKFSFSTPINHYKYNIWLRKYKIKKIYENTR